MNQNFKRHIPKIDPKIAPTIRANHHNATDIHFVSDTPKSTNTQSEFTSPISQPIGTSEISETSLRRNFLILDFFVGGSPASLFPSQGSEEDSRTREELFFSILPDLPKLSDLACYSLKTLKAYSPTTEEEPSTPLSERLMNWGMTYNGKCLTARISEFPKIGKGCLLSDILEEHPDQKYFLSEKMVKNLVGRDTPFGGRFEPMERTTEKVSPTLTARYYKQGKTDPYIKELL